MVDPKLIHQQLKKINFGASPWNQAELRELPRIIHEGEEISECVNGMYEGGVALLVATEMRLLLIDKKPLRYLTVEDFRFDMISEIDYSHRLFNAQITISTGGKTLRFKSYNQTRLRHLINLVQEHMSSGKKDQAQSSETQKQHLEEINKQLQMYLMAQHQQLQQQMQSDTESKPAELPKPDPRLSDYLFAQQLLEQFQKNGGQMPSQDDVSVAADQAKQTETADEQPVVEKTETAEPIPTADIAAAAREEIFGSVAAAPSAAAPADPAPAAPKTDGITINPIKVAYAKLPMMLRNRKFGRPSLHAHSEEQTLPTGRSAASAS